MQKWWTTIHSQVTHTFVVVIELELLLCYVALSV